MPGTLSWDFPIILNRYLDDLMYHKPVVFLSKGGRERPEKFMQWKEISSKTWNQILTRRTEIGK